LSQFSEKNKPADEQRDFGDGDSFQFFFTLDDIETNVPFFYDGRANEWGCFFHLDNSFFILLRLLTRGAWYFLFWQRYPPESSSTFNERGWIHSSLYYLS